MALSYTNVTIELREILLKERPESLLKISPKGTVPVLQLSNNLIIEESIDIMKWAIKNHDSNDLFESKKELQELMINENDSKFKLWLDRYKYNIRYSNYSINICKLHCDKILKRYENLLSEKKYFVSESISFSDIAIFPFIRQFSNVDLDYFIKKYPKIYSWLQLILESDLFISVMKKYPQWKIGDRSLIINFKKI